jgi:uncharacterized protein YacL
LEEIYFSLAIVGFLIVILGIIRLRRMPLQEFVLILTGAIMGLLLGALASVPLSQLPHPLGSVLPFAASVLFTVSFIALAMARRTALIGLMPFLRSSKVHETSAAVPSPEGTQVETDRPKQSEILVDTSVIIDGRIADIAIAGFVPGRLLVPRFVLAELQNIADSDDAMRRGRGRRGLEVLNRLGETVGIEIEIIDQDAPEIKEVDHKLVALAQQRSCDVLTTDYNLNRVAQIQGVRVLNINELANAIRPVVIPGEELHVHIVQPGKERNQGVGYLADGTMIVVENGDKMMGEDVVTEVTRVFQTVAGKMIFAVPKTSHDTPKNGKHASRTQKAKEIVEQPVDETLAQIDQTIAETHAPANAPKRPQRGPRPQRAQNSGQVQSMSSTRQNRRESAEDRLIRTANESSNESL